MEPDNWVLRKHRAADVGGSMAPEGTDEVWAIRLSVDHTKPYGKRGNRSTPVLDQHGHQHQADLHSVLRVVQDVGALGGFNVVDPAGEPLDNIGLASSSQPEAHLALNVRGDEGFASDGIRIGRLQQAMEPVVSPGTAPVMREVPIWGHFPYRPGLGWEWLGSAPVAGPSTLRDCAPGTERVFAGGEREGFLANWPYFAWRESPAQVEAELMAPLIGAPPFIPRPLHREIGVVTVSNDSQRATYEFSQSLTFVFAPSMFIVDQAENVMNGYGFVPSFSDFTGAAWRSDERGDDRQDGISDSPEDPYARIARYLRPIVPIPIVTTSLRMGFGYDTPDDPEIPPLIPPVIPPEIPPHKPSDGGLGPPPPPDPPPEKIENPPAKRGLPYWMAGSGDIRLGPFPPPTAETPWWDDLDRINEERAKKWLPPIKAEKPGWIQGCLAPEDRAFSGGADFVSMQDGAGGSSEQPVIASFANVNPFDAGGMPPFAPVGAGWYGVPVQTAIGDLANAVNGITNFLNDLTNCRTGVSCPLHVGDVIIDGSNVLLRASGAGHRGSFVGVASNAMGTALDVTVNTMPAIGPIVTGGGC